MRRPRLKAPASHPVACDHCVVPSRLVERDFMLESAEKDMRVKLMRHCEQLTQ